MNEQTDTQDCTCREDFTGEWWCFRHNKGTLVAVFGPSLQRKIAEAVGFRCDVTSTDFSQADVDTMLKKPPFKAEPKPLTEKHRPYDPQSVDSIEKELADPDSFGSTIVGPYVAQRLIATIRTLQAENKRLREGHHFIASVSYMTEYNGRPAMELIREKAQEMAGEKTL